MGTFNRLHLIRQVDLFTLRLFLTAIEEKQIGLAAIRENIAPSTATKRIQDLEEVAGIKLLERGPKGVSPSPAGEVLARYVRTIFDSLEDMRSEISAFTEGVRGELVVASVRSVIVPFLARELGEFCREYPLVDPIVHEIENNVGILHQVTRGDADIGVFVARSELDLAGVDVTPYRRDRMVAVLPLGHPLSRRQSVTFEELLGEKLIVVGALQSSFQAAARRLGMEFAPRCSVRSGGVGISLVQAGLGVTVLPECFLGHEMLNRVAAVEFAESWAVRSIHIATAHGRTLSRAARAFVKQLSDRPGDDPGSPSLSGADTPSPDSDGSS